MRVTKGEDMSEYELVVDARNELGEGSLWVPREQTLYWLDILGRLILRYDPATGTHEAFEVKSPITALGIREGGGFVAATETSLAFWDPARPGELDTIVDLVADRPGIRFNDGGVDPRGSFWAGTMNEDDDTLPEGELFRLDPDLGVRRMGSGYTISNGIGWSPDHSTMYFTDTLRRVILAFDYDVETGSIENGRPFIEVPEGEGYPDGMTVDSEGFIWSAQWGGWRVMRYDPQGKPEREIALPAAQVTCPCFGGAGLDGLHVTTARVGLSKDDLRTQPLAGGLFRVDPGVKGLEEASFKG
jgi:sugar lactone lactonase YvrE